MPRVKKFEIEDVSKMTITQCRSAYKKLKEQYLKIMDGAYCHECGEFKSRDKFYKSPKTSSGLIPVCKECLYKIGTGYDEKTKQTHETKESVIEAMRKADLPFLQDLYDNSCAAITNEVSGKKRGTGYSQMITCLQSLPQYFGLTFFDSDMFKNNTSDKIEESKEQEATEEQLIENQAGLDTYDSFLKNKNDVIRLLSYDPFEKEDIVDQPFLYSQLLGLLDSSEDANEDMMRTSSAISIVRGFLQQSKIDDTISKLMCDISNIEKNSATIKSLQESKGKITSVITSLAQDSCISLKHNKNAKKGENTWTGKIKKIKSLNLRSGEVNGFDIDTCRGMQQVQEISDASIMKQLALDESEWSDMVSEMRTVNVDLRREKDAYQEINRILLRENIDLRDTLKENNLLQEDQLKNLKDLYSVFAEFDESSKKQQEEKEENEDESK